VISEDIARFAELRDGIESAAIEMGPVSEEDRPEQWHPSGRWTSSVAEYQGYGQFLEIQLPGEVDHVIANFRPVGDEATSVMIRLLFLNVVGDKAYAFIQALDLKAYLEGIGSRPWTKKFRYQVDLWCKCKG
jgi:hypothetical protein